MADPVKCNKDLKHKYVNNIHQQSINKLESIKSNQEITFIGFTTLD